MRIRGRVREVVGRPGGVLDSAADNAVVPAREHGEVVEDEDVARRVAVEQAGGVDEPVSQRSGVVALRPVGVGRLQRRRDDQHEQLVWVQLEVLEQVEVDALGVADGQVVPLLPLSGLEPIAGIASDGEPPTALFGKQDLNMMTVFSPPGLESERA